MLPRWLGREEKEKEKLDNHTAHYCIIYFRAEARRGDEGVE
jgi:hypothetical protein